MTGNERGAPGRHGHASAHEVHAARGGPAVTPAVPSPVSLPPRLAATKAGGVQATGPGGGPSPPGHGLPPGRTPPGTSHAEPVSRPISATVPYAEDGLLGSGPARGGRQRLCQRPPPRSPVLGAPLCRLCLELPIHPLHPADSFLQDGRQEPPPPPGSPPSTRPATPGCSAAPWPPRPFRVLCVCPPLLTRSGMSGTVSPAT